MYYEKRKKKKKRLLIETWNFVKEEKRENFKSCISKSDLHLHFFWGDNNISRNLKNTNNWQQ